MEKDKTLFYIVVIVAIVAIFAMVLMAVNSNTSSAVKYVVLDAEGNIIDVTDSAGMAMQIEAVKDKQQAIQ